MMIRSHLAGRTWFNPCPTWLMAGCFLVAACPIALGGGRGPGTKAPPKDHDAGRALFIKVWEPGKPSPAGGDGLGPLYNETSCVACHRLGGIGGGGRIEQDVALMTAVSDPTQSERASALFEGELPQLHEGFGAASSIVVHRYSTSSSDQKRLAELTSFAGVNTHDRILGLRKSSRNTPALFGDGMIDAIPDRALYAAEKRTFPGFPEVKGRVSRLPDGRLGRFGWKSQTASLRDFVLAACANELGLEVPGHHQARLDRAAESVTAREQLDMTEEQSDQLIDYVVSLSPPVLRPVREGRREPWGYRLFQQVGCATCHTPELGGVNGLYSDLLLHDMGPSFADAAIYYGGSSSPGDAGSIDEARELARSTGSGAIASEWRTPPLWGVADSAPYMHDGRAATLDDAIRLHGGEAQAIEARYAKLERGDRRNLLQFLHSLTVSAPVSRRAAAIDAIQARAPANRTDAPPE